MQCARETGVEASIDVPTGRRQYRSAVPDEKLYERVNVVYTVDPIEASTVQIGDPLMVRHARIVAESPIYRLIVAITYPDERHGVAFAVCDDTFDVEPSGWKYGKCSLERKLVDGRSISAIVPVI